MMSLQWASGKYQEKSTEVALKCKVTFFQVHPVPTQ